MELDPLLCELLEDKFNVTITYSDDYCDDNQGAMAGNDIWYGRFDDEAKLMSAVMHEIGHVITGRVMQKRHTKNKDATDDFWYCFRYDAEYKSWVWARRMSAILIMPFDNAYANECLSTYAKSNDEWTRPEYFEEKTI